jgi:hypothetical protein
MEQAALLRQINPPACADGPLVKRFPSIEIDFKSGNFNPTKLTPGPISPMRSCTAPDSPM